MTTENPNTPTDEGGDGGEGMVPRSQIRALEAKAAKADEAATKAATLEREVAFLRAGIDTTTEAGQFFFEGYKGDLAADAIKAKAAVLGLSEAPQAPVTPTVEVTEAEQKVAQVAAEAAAGTPGDTPASDDPRAAADKAAKDALLAGAPRETALAASIGVLGSAAAAGDQRALWQPTGVNG